MKPIYQRQAGRISRNHLAAMALILLLGLAAGAWVLRGEPPAREAEAEHRHEEDAPKPQREPAESAHEHEAAEPILTMSAAQIKAAGITVEPAGPARIRTTLQLPGEVRFNEDRTAHVVPRLAGVVESVPVNLGQEVQAGQLLAVISSVALSDLRSELLAAQKRLALAAANHEREKKLFEDKVSPQMDYLQAQQSWREAEIALANAEQKLKALGAPPLAVSAPGSLARYELRAPFTGTVIEKHLALGEAVKEDTAVFTVADLTSVWAEVQVPAQDLARVRVGSTVLVRASALEEAVSGKVSYVSALLGEQSRTATARVVLSNPQRVWRPGLFVTVELAAGEVEAPVTVASTAVQSLEGREVVFLAVPSGFQPVPVKLGRSDGLRTQVLEGLPAGARYAAANSFVIKADIGKATAEHEH